MLLCAAVLSYNTVFAAQIYNLPEQANQLDIPMKQAQPGLAEAQVKLGRAYLDGNGAPKSPSQASAWDLKAAEQGDAASQDSPTAEKIAAAETNAEPEPDKVEPAAELQAEAEIEPAAAEVIKEIKTEMPLKRKPHPGNEEEATLIPGDKLFALEPQQRESLLEEYNLNILKENAADAYACDEARKWYNEGLNLSDDSGLEVSYYQRAIELCPDFAAAHNRLGEIYKSRGEYESAFKEFNQAKKWSLLYEPGMDQRGNRSLLADQFINQGKIYRRQGRYDLAAEQFKRALRINPGSRVAMNQLQYVNKASGKYDNLVLPFLQRISSPIFTMTPGMTLPKGIFSFGFLTRYWEMEADLTDDMFKGGLPDIFQGRVSKRNTEVLQVVLDLRYGLTKNFTIGLFPRWSTIWANADVTDDNKVTGLGDTNLLTKYQFWATRRTRISLFHLLSIPTGDEDAETGDLNIKVPLGSGSFNFRPGIALTTVKEYLEAPLTIHSNISYRITDDEIVPDELRCDLAISYPFSPAINTFMELNYRWRDSYTHPQNFTIRVQGQPGIPIGPLKFDSTIKEKSGYALFISPGLQYILFKDIRLNVGAQIPLIKPKDAWAEKFVLNFGIRGFWDWW